MGSMMRRVWVVGSLVLATGCGGAAFSAAAGHDAGEDTLERSEASTAADGARVDSSGRSDSENADAGVLEAGPDVAEAAAGDSPRAVDAGVDAVVDDATGAGADAAPSEAGLADAPVDAVEAGEPDAGPDTAAWDSGSDVLDGAGDAQAEACASLLFFLDGDGDGYGGTTTYKGCSAPKQGAWVTTGGDCDDSNAAVNPAQTAYFAAGYIPTGKTDVSFDYDCDGQESESGGPAKASCHLMNLSCVGSGYIEASPVRGGPGVDPFCGSAEAVTCALTSLVCQAGWPYTVSPIACH